MRAFRAYHAALAILVVIAYATGDEEGVHRWLGYGVAALIVLRLLLAMAGAASFGLFRFRPNFNSLKLENALTHPAVSRVLILGVAASLLVTVGTGLAMDRGRALGLSEQKLVAPAYADDDDERERGDDVEEALEDIHEAAGNFVLAFIVMHAAYLLLFKRQLALFMLFAAAPRGQRRRAAERGSA